MAWYLLQTKPRQEFLAKENLARQGYSCYHPLLIKEKIVSGGVVLGQEPLFPGYLFVSIAEYQGWSAIRSTYGVRDLVRFGGRAIPVPEEVITNLRERCQNQELEHKKIKQNDLVEVKSGPLAGVNGIFKCKKSDERVIVLIQLLQKHLELEMPLASLAIS